MTIPNRFELRKILFDYLTVNCNAIADVVVEHPVAAIVKPVVVVTLIRNQLAGILPVTTAVNPEIQLSFYALKELELTKPNGVIRQIEVAMEIFLKQSIMPEFSNGFLQRTIDSQYVSRIKLYCAYSIYRFYLGSIR